MLRTFAGLSLLMLAGYSLVLVDGRYLWGPVILACAGAALVVSVWQQKRILSRAQILVSGLLLVGVTLLFTIQAVVTTRDLDKH